MSETPETDAEYAKSGTWRLRMGNAVPIDFARQLERQRDEAVKLRAEEIAEFNAGCDAYKNGVRFADLEVGPHDQTGIGYAWAAFDTLTRQRDEAVACLRRLMKASEKYAKAQMTANVAVENYTDPRPDVNAFSVAMVALHDEEVAARAFLATLDRTEKP
jgi:hypothetical protein